MHGLRHAVPAEQHDAEETCLEKEGGQHLVGHQRADDVAAASRQLAPIGAELVGEHDARHHAHAERYGEDLRPVLGDAEIDVLAGPEPQRLEHDEPGGKADGERRKEDVEGDGERELDARQKKRVELWHPWISVWQFGRNVQRLRVWCRESSLARRENLAVDGRSLMSSFGWPHWVPGLSFGAWMQKTSPATCSQN